MEYKNYTWYNTGKECDHTFYAKSLLPVSETPSHASVKVLHGNKHSFEGERW
jgi:hypothetical protein